MNPILNISKQQLSKAAIEQLKATPKVKAELAKVRKATQDVEAIFLKQLIGEMRKSSKEGMFGKGIEGEMYADFLDEAVAQAMSRGRGVGMAKQLYGRMEEATLRKIAGMQKAEKSMEGSKITPESSGKETNP